MVKVLTIRDPKTGDLIAEARLEPDESTQAAVARIFRTTLNSAGPAFEVVDEPLIHDAFLKWSAQLDDESGQFGLFLVRPTSEPRDENARLVLWRVSETEPAARIEFPMRKDELEKIKNGQRRTATIPVKPGSHPRVGDRVTFLESAWDVFGEPILVSNGDSVSVELSKVEDQGRKWFGQDLYSIEWIASQARKRSTSSAKQGSA